MSSNSVFGVEFYPTPDDLIHTMLKKIDWKDVKNVLEPSAGKGNIISYFRENKYDFWGRNLDWFWFEIDLNLRKMLNGRCELLGFDFLGFQDVFIEFDVIVMNPPFSNGIDHILKAWEILNTGQLVCVLNAETVRSPNSHKKEKLVALIKEFWSVEYISSAFEEAERKTSVEVAVVYLKKTTDRYANIFAEFKDNLNSEYEALFSTVEDSELVKRWEIESLLAYNRIMKKQLVETTISQAKLTHYLSNFSDILGDKRMDMKDSTGSKGFKETILDGVKYINRSCWNSFFNTNKQIRSRTTTKVYEDFISKYSRSCMDFTSANIHFVIQAIIASSDDIHKQNMEELFDKFIRYADHEQREARKTNYGWKIGKKVILPYMCDTGRHGGVKVKYDKLRELSDIERVLCTLDARNFDDIHSAQNLDRYKGDLTPWLRYSFSLFKVKFFKKGTMHLQFHDQELVDKFNYEVAKSKMWVHN